MFIYAAPWVEVDGWFQPAGVDLLDPVDHQWSVLKLDNAKSLCVLGSRDPLPSLPAGVIEVAAAIAERLTVQRLNALGNRLGENLTERDLPALLLALYTSLADGVKRKPLLPALRNGVRRTEMWLAGEKFVDLPVVSGGGVEFTDDFNRAGPGLGANWDDDLEGGATQWGIDSNELSIVATDGSRGWAQVLTDMSSADHYVEVTKIDGGTLGAQGPTVRGSSGNLSCYMGGPHENAGRFIILEFDSGGSSSVIGDNTPGGSRDATYNWSANGSSLELLRDGVSAVTATDSTLTGVRVGMHFTESHESYTWDDFEAGTPAAGPTPPNINVYRTSRTIFR